MRSIVSGDDVAHAKGKTLASAFLMTGMLPPSIVFSRWSCVSDVAF